MKTKSDIQESALNVAFQHEQCGLALSMGIGKTYTGLKYLSKYFDKNLKVLVAVPKLSVKQSWKDEAIKYNLEYLLESITFTTYLSLNKQDTDFDIIILDECHNLKLSHHNFLLSHQGRVLGLTGTPPRIKTSEKGKMVNKFCPMKFEYLTDDAITDNLLNNYEIIVHRIPLSTKNDLLINTKTSSWYTSEQKNYDYWTDRINNETSEKQLQFLRIQRMTVIKGYPSKENYVKNLLKTISNKCIVFANTQDQSDRLCSHSYHSKNPNSKQNLEDFKNDKIKQLSCVLQLSEGVNIFNLKEGIIMHAYSNNRKLSQRFGRLLRLEANETATIHVLCYKDTIDEIWVKQALEEFDNTKIKWKN